MKSAQSFTTESEEETLALGRRLADMLPAQGVVLLIGDLGAGKTTLAKGIVEGRRAARPEDVSSPTYTLIHEYGQHGKPAAVYHVDLYRLDTAEQARRIGLEDLFEQPGLVLIEWGDRFPELVPPGAITIQLRSGPNESRLIDVKFSLEG